MSQNQSTFMRAPPPPPPMQIHCTSAKVTRNGHQNGTPNFPKHCSQNQEEPRIPRTTETLLVASVNGQSVGGGPGVLYSAINGNAPQNQGFRNSARVGSGVLHPSINGNVPPNQGFGNPAKVGSGVHHSAINGNAPQNRGFGNPAKVGSGVLHSAINGNVPQNQGFNGNSAKMGASKVNSNDPQVRKLVYNMYRGLLSTKHERANNIVEAAPHENVQTDGGVGERVLSMLRQQSQLKEGKMMNLGPPPPPPPPPFSTGEPTTAPAPRPSTAEVISKPQPPTVSPPAALAGAMLKDKKPFTYTPGGFNLAEINANNPAQPAELQQNGAAPSVNFGSATGHPAMQSKSFRVLQNVYDNHDFAGEMTGQEVQPEPKKYTGSNIPSRSFRMLQAMTDTENGPGPGESDL